jgi:hypothetical protein
MRKKWDNTPERLLGDLPNISVFIDRGVDAVNLEIALANHIPRRRREAQPPQFRGETSEEFEAFLDVNFPRRKFASLRRVLRKAERRKVVTPLQLYRHIVLMGDMLHAAAIMIEPFALLQDECPPLRICDCGKLFVPSRKDVWACSTTCRDRVRKAEQRHPERRDRYKKNRIQKEDERERQRKAR